MYSHWTYFCLLQDDHETAKCIYIYIYILLSSHASGGRRWCPKSNYLCLCMYGSCTHHHASSSVCGCIGVLVCAQVHGNAHACCTNAATDSFVPHPLPCQAIVAALSSLGGVLHHYMLLSRNASPIGLSSYYVNTLLGTVLGARHSSCSYIDIA